MLSLINSQVIHLNTETEHGTSALQTLYVEAEVFPYFHLYVFSFAIYRKRKCSRVVMRKALGKIGDKGV